MPADDVNPVLGIDLGTTFSAIARWNGRGAECYKTATGDEELQSVVYFDPRIKAFGIKRQDLLSSTDKKRHSAACADYRGRLTTLETPVGIITCEYWTGQRIVFVTDGTDTLMQGLVFLRIRARMRGLIQAKENTE